MPDDTTRDELARLQAEMVTMRAEQAADRARHAAELAALRRQMPRPRRRALLPALCLALLVALVPTSLLAVNPFTDLNPGSVHNANIDAIYNAGVTTGCVPNAEYCPNANVTREEMASFLARLGGLGTNPPVADAATLDGFAPSDLVRVARAIGADRTDIDPTTVHRITTTLTALPVPAALEPLVSVTLTAPGPGFVIVAGATGFNLDEDTGGLARLRAVGSGDTSPILGCGLMDETNTACSLTPVFVFPVEAGDQTFVLEVAKQGPNVARAFNGVLTALFVPFGATGTTALEVP